MSYHWIAGWPANQLITKVLSEAKPLVLLVGKTSSFSELASSMKIAPVNLLSRLICSLGPAIEMLSPNPSFHTLSAIQNKNKCAWLGKVKGSQWVSSILKYAWNVCKRCSNVNHSYIVKIINRWSQLCDYYVGCHRRPSSEKAYAGNGLLFFLQS